MVYNCLVARTKGRGACTASGPRRCENGKISLIPHFNTFYHYNGKKRASQAFSRLFFDSIIEKGKIYGVFTENTLRIDKFLKVSRILKRRTVAQEACSAGKVMVNGRLAKPSHEIKEGDVVEILYNTGTLKFRVLAVKEVVKKDDAQNLYEIIA